MLVGGSIVGSGGVVIHVCSTIDMMERLVKVLPGLDLLESSSYGRGLISKSDLAPGKEVFVTPPFLHVISSTSRGSLCDQCLKSSDKNISRSLLKCSQCKYVYYCGKNCQKKDWSLHKVECKSLVTIHPHSPSDTMRLVLRVLQRRKNKLKKKDKSASQETMSGREIDFLCSNKDRLSEEVKEEMSVQIIGVSKLMSGDPDYSTEEAYDILCKVICNTFYILDWSMNAVAAGLYLLPSLLNHSCAPNCVVVYNGLQLSVRTIKGVKSGHQLFISYTDLLEPKEIRQSHLSRVYSFQCSCERCLGEDEVAAGLLAAANDDIPASVVKKMIEEGLLKIQEDVHSKKKAHDWQGVLDLCQHLISQYDALLSPLNIVMIKLHQEILEARLELQQWTEALETAEHLLKPYQSHLLKNHISLAVHLIKMAKLRRVIATTEQLQLSVGDLSQALDILKICHGANHPLTDKVELILRDSQGELVRRQSRT